MQLVSDDEVKAFLQDAISVPDRARLYAFCDAWRKGVDAILERMDGGPNWYAQRRLAERLVTAWHEVLPFTLVTNTKYEFPAGDALDTLRGFFNQLKSYAAMVRVLCAVLYADSAEELDRVRTQLDETEQFCDECLAGTTRDDTKGTVFCTDEGFEGITASYREMLTFVLTPELSVQFIESYNAVARALDSYRDVLRVTGPAH